MSGSTLSVWPEAVCIYYTYVCAHAYVQTYTCTHLCVHMPTYEEIEEELGEEIRWGSIDFLTRKIKPSQTERRDLL